MDGEKRVNAAVSIGEFGPLALQQLDALDVRLSALCKDAHRMGDEETVKYCQAQKKENAAVRDGLLMMVEHAEAIEEWISD